jgi:hypothetical protein
LFEDPLGLMALNSVLKREERRKVEEGEELICVGKKVGGGWSVGRSVGRLEEEKRNAEWTEKKVCSRF